MNTKLVLRQLGIQNSHLLGKGGEGWVYALDQDKAVKVYKGNPGNLDDLVKFQQRLSSYHFPFATPQILNMGEIDGTVYTIEKRLQGKALDKILPSLTSDQKQEALANYFEAMQTFNTITLPDLPFGQILGGKETIKAPTWKEFLHAKLTQVAEKSRKNLDCDVSELDLKIKILHQLVDSLAEPEKHLVHCDYYLNNVLVGDDLKISTVLDFGIHSVVGDPLLDVSSLLFLKLTNLLTPQEIEFSYGLATKKYEAGVQRTNDIYGLYYSFYYSDTKETDRNSYQWCVTNLNDNSVWQRLGIPIT